MQTNPAIEQSKIIWSERVRGISSVGKKKVYGGKDLLKSQVLEFRMKYRNEITGIKSLAQTRTLTNKKLVTLRNFDTLNHVM